MKEKTFEELIIEQFCEDGLIKMGFSRNDLIKMMQQVREATIAECIEKVEPRYMTTIFNLKRLPTDRIKHYETPTESESNRDKNSRVEPW